MKTLPLTALAFAAPLAFASFPAAAQTSRAPLVDIGVVTPTQVVTSEEVSGRIVLDPKTFLDIPGLHVAASAASGSQIDGNTAVDSLDPYVIDFGGGRTVPASDPFTWTPPATPTDVTMRRRDNSRPVIKFQLPAADGGRASTGFTTAPDIGSVTMPPITTAGGVEVIHGETGTNGGTMSVAVDGVGAPIVAAKRGTVFWRVPSNAAPGPHEVTFVPGPGKAAVKLPMYVLGLEMTADHTNLIRGQSTKMHIRITGLDQLPAAAWQSGLPPADLIDLEKVKAAGEFPLPKPTDPGYVLLVLENKSPEIIRMGAHGSRIVLQLYQRDFAKGPYTYDDKLQSLQRGAFDIRGTVVAFLDAVPAQPK